MASKNGRSEKTILLWEELIITIITINIDEKEIRQLTYIPSHDKTDSMTVTVKTNARLY